MTSSVVLDSCRLTVISPRTRVDLAVPTGVTVGELLSIVVGRLGRDLADQGVAEGGWILQRAAELPLDPSMTLAAAQIRDGDVLHLRTRATRLPEIAFDDVLEAVSTGVLTRTARWKPAFSTRMSTTLAGVLLGIGLLTALSVGPRWVVPSITLGVAAFALAATAAILGRIFHRRGPSVTAGGFAIAYAAACGATALGQSRSLLHFGSPQLLVGAGAAALVAVALVAIVGIGFAGYVAVVTLAVLTAIGTAISAGTDLGVTGTASIVAAVALAASPVLPILSFRLSRLPLPQIPSSAEDLRRDTGTVDAQQILGLAVRADQFLTGLIGGVALAIGGAAVFLTGHGVSEYILAAVLGVVCLLRGRLFTGLAQRALLLAGGALAIAATIVGGVLDTHGQTRILAFAVPSIVVAVALVGLSGTLATFRATPPWARAADVLESILVLSVIPLALGVMGVYGAIRTNVS